MDGLTGIDLRRDVGLLLLIAGMGLVASGLISYVAHPITLLAPVPLLVGLLLLDHARLTSPVWLVSVAALMTWTVLLYLAMDGTATGLVHSLAMYAPFAALAFRIERPEPVAFAFAVVAATLLSIRVVVSWVWAGAVWLPWQVYEGNDLASRLNVLLPVVLALWFAVPPERRWERFLLLVLLGEGVTSIVLTQQRAGLGVLAVLVVLGLARTSWKALVGVGVATIAAWLVLSQSITSMLERIRIVNFDPSNATRPEIWTVALDATRESSWLGVGPGNSDDALRELGGGHAHNGLVQSALESGLLGALLFGALAVYLLALAARLYRQGGQNTLWALSLLAYLGFSIVSAPIQRPDFTLALVVVVMAAREHVGPRSEPCAG